MVSRTSRKKIKGKDRMAKKLEALTVEAERAKARNIWLKWVTGDEKVVGKFITCNHGWVWSIASISDDNPVIRFMDKVFGGSADKLNDVIHLHPQVWNNDKYREMAVSILIRVGTNMLLSENADVVGAVFLARVITILENYNNGTNSLDVIVRGRRAQTKMLDLNTSISSGRRDGLKFFSKRVSCSCLKKMHQEVRRTQPKMGKCYGCSIEKERVALSVCSRCMLTRYCSRECQVSNWREHKKECDIFVKVHEQQTQLAAGNSVQKTGN